MNSHSFIYSGIHDQLFLVTYSSSTSNHIPDTQISPLAVDLNLLSWSSTNLVALSLSGTVYLWNASSGSITELCEIDSSADEYVSCVEWAKDGNVLAVSNSLGAVQVCYTRLLLFNLDFEIDTLLTYWIKIHILSVNLQLLDQKCGSVLIFFRKYLNKAKIIYFDIITWQDV